MKIGDEVYVHGYVDEIRQGVVIIRNNGGYFGTIAEEVLLTGIEYVADRKTEPKPICESCSKNPCKKKEMINDIGHWVSECTEFDRKTEPQYRRKYEGSQHYRQDEPQTDCPWK